MTPELKTRIIDETPLGTSSDARATETRSFESLLLGDISDIRVRLHTGTLLRNATVVSVTLK